MKKSILLTRPHTLIVAKMKPFLEDAGFSIPKLLGMQATFVGVDSANDVAAHLGRQETFLYFTKDDLANPQRRVIATRLIQRNFR
ncbi:MAG: hypothetical protein KJ614_15580 [Gammaproteobacteria bacterium]|uniref:hypothetical protein n=1 Tax=Rhodoferax sp. TaxID=50421 RepID=UPI0017ED67B1|nr:hypothetical protein [Rhodoferax sp.]MBU3900316.1 hypothetical protein [Gammaproteobacteria bacterium]MBA3058496.1 hypothetical protein [Rhodoferax sp.]MBU3998044.1 hypothetical protein [Gammaproteobacteria bacterium]MBU4018903.1 hypothetical protein [Gammaproteobacteria bacterium]MBU4080893.1 hypothetical protein [Gammaproteobacteria bacterium]